MDFYSAQDQARRRSRRLIALFAFAVLTVIVLLWLSTIAWFSPFHGYQDYLRSLDSLSPPSASPGLFERILAQPGPSAAILAAWAAVLLVPVAWRSYTLSRSGEVARSLGGVRASADTADPAVRRLLNVVEEMAIAAGLPVPEVYVLEHEPSINAFAAGLTQAQATIGITRGALQALDRDQLQGVIAHEYSHILNGDMRLNVRLMAWIAGLFGIAELGRVILRGREGRNVSSGATLGLPMILIGMAGVFVGRLLQAGISRQREWLADASAVQFTRNADGLRGALLAIARQPGAPGLRAPRAQDAAHLFFVQGVRRWMATHPPIHERIRALDRSARHRRLQGADDAAYSAGDSGAGDAGRAGLSPLSTGSRAQAAALSTGSRPRPHGAESLTPAALAGRAGTVDPALAPHAGDRLRAIPAAVRDAATPWQAAEVMIALALSGDAGVRERQLDAVRRRFGGECGRRVEGLFLRVRDLEPRLRLPAAQSVFPRLRGLPMQGRSDLSALLVELARADGVMDVFEFCLARLASTWLRDMRQSRGPAGKGTPDELGDARRLLLSALAWHGAVGQPEAAREALAAGFGRLGYPSPASATLPEDWQPRLWRAFDRLDGLDPHDKREVVAAMAAVALHDGVVHPAESELLRTACAVLHCPLPLLEGR